MLSVPGLKLHVVVLAVLTGVMPSAGLVCDALCAAQVVPPPSPTASHCGDDDVDSVHAPQRVAPVHLGDLRHAAGCNHPHPAILVPAAPASAKSLVSVDTPGAAHASVNVSMPPVSSIPRAPHVRIVESSPARAAFPLRI